MDPEQLQNKVYLGDGLYAGYDGWHIWLYTPQGNQVALEPPVLKAFMEYVDQNYDPK